MSIKEHPPQDETNTTPHLHVPVLLQQTLQAFDPQPDESYLDLTAGYAGHASAILERTKNYSNTVLVDRDSNAIDSLQSFANQGVRLLHTDFVSAARQLGEEGKQFDIILVDLGVSSPQLDRAERGFSFTNSGPLDMRMDDRMVKTAELVVNTYSERNLIRIIVEYGEEAHGFARRIAKAIVQARPFHTTKELADLILKQHRGSWQKIHPATRTFQALRIEVNDELSQVRELMPLIPQLLTKGGRVGIISFHSLEDRIVKQYFKQEAGAGYESSLDIVTRKPVSGATDDVHNPRARSAKLRVAVKK
ncbi:S-adenosyl-methyltransferase MraW [Candidatus Saccharibacteria bacterium RAAC3_TM7_1]|nr:S-adenosyl-methyltransferase MraW [Candidatus Saccharibacteria bacterium RAAC3_TM7_1]HCZ28381.1 16S rRNA (cytosine(1402)-N(4))-methyltransferase RsmH [Candidatus Saccharibacteria bacterium]